MPHFALNGKLNHQKNKSLQGVVKKPRRARQQSEAVSIMLYSKAPNRKLTFHDDIDPVRSLETLKRYKIYPDAEATRL